MTEQKRIWVHIGLPKCGSTTIQGYFADHDAHYRKHGLCYPTSYRRKGGYRSHHPIIESDTANLPEIADAIAAEAQDARDILISCEDYTTHLSPQFLARDCGKTLVAELGRAIPDARITVIAYFRNLYDFIESCYAQFVMAGLFQVHQGRFFSQDNPGLADFVTEFETAQGFSIYSIRQFAERIRTAFPDSDIMLRSLEKQDLGGTGIIEDLCQVMGYTPLPMNKRRNTRAANRTLAAAQFLRTRLKNDEFIRVRKALRKLDLDSLAPDPKAPFRNRAICIGGQLRDVIRDQIAIEKDTLPELFATPMDTLIEDRWKPLVPGSQLTPAMRKKAMAMARRKLAPDSPAS